MHLIETRDLCYAYPHSVKALEGINFIAPRNSRIAVIGSNGAGKSTLFKHFNGIFRPTSGSVLIRGEPITKQNIREVRKFVGIVFQNADDQIFSPTVEQDVAFGPTNLGLDEETIHHRVHEALKIVGIEDLARRDEGCPRFVPSPHGVFASCLKDDRLPGCLRAHGGMALHGNAFPSRLLGSDA